MIVAPPPFVVSAPAAAGATGALELRLTQSGPLGRVLFYVPPGWKADLGQPAGTPVARVRFRGKTGTQEGTLLVTDPGLLNRCVAPPNAAVWAPKVFPAPPTLFVNPTTAADSRLGGYRAETCPGTVESIDARFLASVFANPTAVGLYTWRAIVTPPAPAMTYELQSQVPVPHILTVRVRSGRVSGRLSFEELPEEGAQVRIYSLRGRLLARATTRGDGSYSVRLPRRYRRLRRVLARTLARPAICKQPTLPRCTATVAPATASSRP